MHNQIFFWDKNITSCLSCHRDSKQQAISRSFQSVEIRRSGTLRFTASSGLAGTDYRRIVMMNSSRQGMQAKEIVYASRQLSRNQPRTARASPITRREKVIAHGAVYTSTLNVGGFQVTSPKAWGIIADTLRGNDVKVISQQELLFAKEKGGILIDIRPFGEYDKGHIEDAFNVPLYQLIEGWDLVKIIRRAGFAFFGIFNGTEVNPDFKEEILSIEALQDPTLAKNTPIVVICQFGGTLTPTVNIANGKQSRALIAAYEILKLGFTNLSVLKGGFNEWQKNDRPYFITTEEEEEA